MLSTNTAERERERERERGRESEREREKERKRERGRGTNRESASALDQYTAGKQCWLKAPHQSSLTLQNRKRKPCTQTSRCECAIGSGRAVCYQANVSHMRQSGPDSGLGFQVKVREHFEVISFSLTEISAQGLFDITQTYTQTARCGCAIGGTRFEWQSERVRE